METQWIFAEPSSHDSARIADALGLHPLVARLLVNRNITCDEARAFIHPSMDDLNSPFAFRDMQKTVERINRAMRDQEKILVFGDYDVDGVCSIAMLIRFFRMFHYQVDFYVPDRSSEGYGLNADAVRTVAGRGTRLLITVDCGINDRKEIELANELGMDVIVVDHHEYQGPLPPACAVLNPKIDGCSYPYRELAAVGVTFKLVEALTQRISRGMKTTPEFVAFLSEALGMVALGSVADVVPLRAENRAFVCLGMKALAQSRLPGLCELFNVCSIDPADLKTWHIAYHLAPRINAAGRIADAGISVRLLTTDSTDEARELARALDRENRNRQKVEGEIYRSAVEKLRNVSAGEQPKVIVLSDESWHPGVIGIVASRLVEEFHCPAVLIALNGDAGRGSARSIPAYHIYDAFAACEEKLLSYGGHSAAAGMEILKDEIESFHLLLLQDAERKLTADDLKPKLHIDAKVSLDDLSFQLMEEIALLAPYGRGNPEPLFAAENVTTAGCPQLIGSTGKHLSFRVQSGDTVIRAVAFNFAHILESISEHGTPVSLVFRPRISSYSGRVELNVKDVRTS